MESMSIDIFHQLLILANVPVKGFWAAAIYDLTTVSYQRDIDKSSIDFIRKS